MSARCEEKPGGKPCKRVRGHKGSCAPRSDGALYFTIVDETIVGAWRALKLSCGHTEYRYASQPRRKTARCENCNL